MNKWFISYMKNIKESQPEVVKDTDLRTMELKANLNSEQRDYLALLKAKMKKILGNKTKEQLAKAGDLASLIKYKAVLGEILEFLRKKEMKYSKITAVNSEGEKIEVDLTAELEKSKEFFENQGIDWVGFPDEIHLNQQQEIEFKRCVKWFGFNRVMVIPEGLVDTADRHIRYALNMAKYFRNTKYEPKYPTGEKYPREKNKLRLILYRDQQGLDKLYLSTRAQGADKLLAKGGLLDTLRLDGMSESEFLAIQQRYFMERGDYMYFGEEILLLGNGKIHFDTRVISVHWEGIDDNKSPKGLGFDGLRSNLEGAGVGAPLVKSFEIEGE